MSLVKAHNMATLTFLKGGGVGGEDEDDSLGNTVMKARGPVSVLGVLLVLLDEAEVFPYIQALSSNYISMLWNFLLTDRSTFPCHHN